MTTVPDNLKHAHDTGIEGPAHEDRTRWVVALTFAMMLAELAVGYATNSLALTADGWHMATHTGALGMALLAYWFARKQAASSAFSFGTGKVHALAGYTSAVVLALIALVMAVESLRRFVRPEPIAFAQALPVAVLGLLVNLVSARLLHVEHHHHEDHDESAAHDHNLSAAYFHVLSDALTSALAILALLGGRYFGWVILDAVMGVVGGVVIARWSYRLCRQAAKQLLDVVPSAMLVERIRACIERTFTGARVVDLHLWEIGPNARACILSVATSSPEPPSTYRRAIASVATLEHVTVEVHPIVPQQPAADCA